MSTTVLVTGGAGFIGSHLCDQLLADGHRVRVLDSLLPQVHGDDAGRPDYLDGDVELFVGDVRDASAVGRALGGVDAVYHFAAAVGVGQSMYRIHDYTSVNDLGTAVLLEQLAEKPVERLIVASSMSVYGEGLYVRPDGSRGAPLPRSAEQLKRGEWEPRAADGAPLMPVPTPEDKQPDLLSVYALNKYVQERACLIVAKAYGMQACALRFFNVFGSRQALSNPYTGVLAIFASRLANAHQPMIFEDGRQMRDFVHVHDVARAARLALTAPAADGQVVNVGSGRPIAVLEVADALAQAMGLNRLDPIVTGRYRTGDVRHCFADVSAAKRILGYEAQLSMADGLAEMLAWLDGRTAVDRVEGATSELMARGLVT
jgi:dTDP-L-rhamnose 4-epimerase